jgi:hypothetical protein
VRSYATHVYDAADHLHDYYVHPEAIPCRGCQAAPGQPCKYKNTIIIRALGGHDARTPKSYRRYHHKRVSDALLVRGVRR